jgi:hypothetical protein
MTLPRRFALSRSARHPRLERAAALAAIAALGLATGCASVLDLGADDPATPAPDASAGQAPHPLDEAGTPVTTAERKEAGSDEAGTDALRDDATPDAPSSDPDSGSGDDDDAGPPLDTLPITFDLTRAVIAGTGCQPANTRVTPMPGGFTVELDALATDLSSGSARADMRSCLLRVPATIPPGHFLAHLRQAIAYRVTTTASDAAAVAGSTTLFQVPIAPKTLAFPTGAPVDVADGFWSSVTEFDASSSFYRIACEAQTTETLLAVNLALSATGDSARVAIPRFSFVQGIDYALSPCSASGGIAGGAN